MQGTSDSRRAQVQQASWLFVVVMFNIPISAFSGEDMYNLIYIGLYGQRG